MTDDGQMLHRPGGQGLVAQTRSPIPDVPMPIGFKVVNSKSSATVTPTARIVDHLYQGLSTVADAVVFYRRVLAENNWSPDREQTHGSRHLMVYTKGRERLELETWRDGGVVSVFVRIRDNTTAPGPAKP
jgi:hypothetical protein